MQHQELAAFLVVLSLCGIVAFSIISEAANTTISTTTQTTSAASTSTSSASTSSTSTTASTTTVNAPSLSLVSAKASNSTATQNQTEQLTVNVTGGVPPYSYSFLISNSLTGNVLFGAQTTNSLPGNSVSFVLPIEANDVGQLRFTANVADSTGANVLGTGAITVNAIRQQQTTNTPASSTKSVQSFVNASAVSSLLSFYTSNLINSAAGSQFNATAALNINQLNTVTIKLSGMGIRVNHRQLNLSYGSVSQGGRIVGAGNKLYYVEYNGNDSATEYAVSVGKRVPDLHVRIGNFTTNSSMGNMTLVRSVYSKIVVNGVPRIYPKSSYSVSPVLSSSLLGNNTLNFSYSIYTGGSLRAVGSSAGNAISKTFSLDNVPISQPTKIVFDAQGNSNYTAVDPTIYVEYTTANSNVNLPSGTVLASDLICGSLTVSSGNTLITAGYSILCNGTITNSGTISSGGTTNNPGNGGTGAGTGGTSETSAYGGSGGGGGGDHNSGGNGGENLAANVPVSNANIQTWYGSGGLAIQTYLEGAGGGSDPNGDAGGSGSYGIYMQANKIVEGTVSTTGVAGTASSGSTKGTGGAGGNTYDGTGTLSGGAGGASANGKPASSSGGGGGGGVIILSYGAGGLTAGTSTVTGGAGGSGATDPGGSGGNGVAVTFSFGTSAPIVVLEQPQSTGFSASTNPISEGATQTLTATVSNGLSPYTYNYIVSNSVGQVTNALYTGVASTTNTFAYTQQSSWGTGTFTANLIVTDSTTTPTNTVTNTLTYTVAGMSITSATVSNSVADQDQYEKLSISISAQGTTTPYSYNFLVTNSQTSNVIFSSIQSSSSTSNTITFRLPEAANDIGKLTFTANVLDSSVPAYNALASTTFTAYNAFYPVAITSSPSPAQGSPVTLNMIVTGGDPTYTYDFLVTNTFVTPVNIVYNSITTGVSATNDVLTFTIPTSSQNANAVGTLTLTGNVLDSASSPNNVLITNTMIVESQATCIPSISNTLVNFGSVQAGGFAPTANAVQINNVGTGAGNIIIYSTSGTTGNWVYLSNSFLVGNTLWDLRSRSANNGNQLTNSITTDTFNSLGAGDAADLYFGLNVPAGQPSGTYTQGITVALSCGSSSAINYVPITLSNSQNSATPSDFQQQITFSGSSYSSYANSNLSNVEFTTGSGGTGTVLNAWCESGCSNSASSSTFWVNMGTDTIGISSNVIIYMNFMGSSSPVTNGYTGYAPQLYCASGCEQTSYAQYDNGASVFANYWNFEGTSLPAGWSSTGADPTDYAVSNYLQVGIGTGSTTVGVQYETALTSPLLVDTLVKSDTVSGGTPTAGLELSTSNTLSSFGYYFDGYLDGYAGTFSSGMEIYSVNSLGGLTGITSTSGASAPFALTNQWLATGSEALDVNYVQEVSASDSTVTYGNYYVGYIDSGGTYQHNTVYQWLRTREYPPNGIMPSVTFGSVA